MNEKENTLNQAENEEAMQIVSDDSLQGYDTVSGGDMPIMAYTAVSGGDNGIMPLNDIDMSETNMLLSAILFFLVATWCIDRIKSGIRRLMKHE